MLFRQSELLRWFGVSAFEIWIWLLRNFKLFKNLLLLPTFVVADPCVGNISIWWLWTRRNCIGRRIKLHNNVIRTTVPALLPRLILIIWNTSLGVFSVLLVLKVEGVFPDSTSWFLVFAPLFSSDGINAYFCIIGFIRQYLYQEFSNAPLRTLWSLLVIGSEQCTMCIFFHSLFYYIGTCYIKEGYYSH